jgi:peroxiredoxin
MNQGFEELQGKKVLEKALKTGDKVPTFVLPNSQGSMIRSHGLLEKGPLLILFFRGKW